MEIKDLVLQCEEVTKSKGFSPETQHLKQMLLIGSEVAEALFEINMGNSTSPDLIGYTEEFLTLMDRFERTRKVDIMEENSDVGSLENLKEELADIVIRVASYCGCMGIDLEFELQKKIEKNRKRPKLHGKKF